MSDTVETLFEKYAAAYSQRDMEDVTSLCRWPFLAVRRGEAIHLGDRDAVREHFASAIEAYRFTGAESLTWTPVEIQARELGVHSVFATVHWNAVDGDNRLVRDTWTSYQLLSTPEGWRFVSYTNHF